MIGKIDVDKKNVDIRLTRKGTLDVSEVQDGKRKKKNKNAEKEMRKASESVKAPGKQKRERKRTIKYRNGCDRVRIVRTTGGCKGRSNAVGG